MKGMIYVSPQGFEEDRDLATCLDFVRSLPPKKPKSPKKAKAKK